MGARFVRLGIAGFKSFADSVSLEILPGLTGIVGPNGCGKSNVAEALRWAMGETNVRHLRGGEMDDVIFAGTANRPSRNLAEVTLHIEGDQQTLPPPFANHAELQVVRRIERGSGSGYRVNGREARARDVQTLFADLASGARSSAMVSQGRVGTLVNARPEERRAVLEEAAGITGLHARRSEAETRLRAAEANLERAAERRDSLDKQLSGLRMQAKQAARYRDVMTALVETEATLLGLQRARALAAKSNSDEALRQATDALARITATAEAAAQSARLSQSALPAARDNEATARTNLERARVAEENTVAEVTRAQAALAAALQRHNQVVRDLAHAQSVLQDADSADSRLVAESAQLQAEAEAYPAAIDAARREADAAAAALDGADKEAVIAAAAVAEATAQATSLRHMLDQAEARYRRAQEAHARLSAERARVASQMVDPAKVDAAVMAQAAADQAARIAQTEQDRAEAARTEAAPAAATARSHYAALDAARHKLVVETSALAEVLGVKDNEQWRPLVDRLVVPSGLEAALGAALGEELAAADNPAAARHWRALPPLDKRPIPGTSLAGMVEAPAVLDRALSGIGLVQSDSEGDEAQARLQPGQSLVSATGAVWRWDGYTVRAGTATAAAIRLQQRNRLTGLQARLSEAGHAASAARTARDTAEAAERSAVAAEQQARTARRDTEAAAGRARAAAQALVAQAEAATARLAALDEQASQIAPETAASTGALHKARDDYAARQDPATVRAAADQSRSAVAAARSRDAAASRHVDALQRADQARQARLVGIVREREDRRMRAADLRGRVTDLEARAAEAAREHEQREAAPAKAAQDAEQARAATGGAESHFRTTVGAREDAEQASETAATAARAAEHDVFKAREAIVRAEGAREAALQGCETVEARIAEREQALPPLPVPEDLSSASEDRTRHRLHRLTRERDDMGPVNLRADLEAQAIEADIATIDRDGAELATAIAKLRGNIGHLNREGRERLTAVFQQVDRHFQALFARMFGGGRAHLALVGSDDPLQAGLEIFAQPPGKKLASLGLLSGGEQALTALSLIFAVFRCNPAPLCVLDEVDAPLDDANVDRFCALLADMVQETGTRFLVVTHHQVTMARMDRLYGVTMQERGVSRLLSVDLSRAVTMVEAVAAE